MLSATAVPAKDQVSCEVADEVVVLDVKAGIHYGLNSVGARIWDLIREPRTVDQIRDAIVKGGRARSGFVGAGSAGALAAGVGR